MFYCTLIGQLSVGRCHQSTPSVQFLVDTRRIYRQPRRSASPVFVRALQTAVALLQSCCFDILIPISRYQLAIDFSSNSLDLFQHYLINYSYRSSLWYALSFVLMHGNSHNYIETATALILSSYLVFFYRIVFFSVTHIPRTVPPVAGLPVRCIEWRRNRTPASSDFV